jgi:hypothetical protein
MITRRVLAFGLAILLAQTTAIAQPRPPAPASPGLSASRSVMAGSMLTVFVTAKPAGARLAIARPSDPASSAIVVVDAARPSPVLQTPGAVGSYELRLTVERDGAPVILTRQPLETTQATATLAAPDRIARGQTVPVRGIGPNGEQDRVVLVTPEALNDAEGPRFFPAENVEATLEGPEKPGTYELRYVMNAPLSGQQILARHRILVE